MSWHSIIQYWKYRLKAQTRHGVHSPFVYAFIEHGLMPTSNVSLMQRIKNYFAGYDMAELDVNEYDSCVDSIANANEQTVLIIHGIHQTETATANWNRLSRKAKIKLSIDLYSIGLLFFNEDIKEQQHFVLKYPL